MIAPTFVITKVYDDKLLFLRNIDSKTGECDWSVHLALIFNDLEDVVLACREIEENVAVRSIGFVGKV